jgi:lipid-A-disaccharide synthase
MDNKEKKIWIISGEESGDIYGALLIEELRNIDPNKQPDIYVMGGKRMASTGAEVMVDSTELGVVGFLEVLNILFTIAGIFRRLVKRAKTEKPDCVVLIDYPGFNLRFARQMHRLNIPVVWYISPQVWAWKKGRIRKLVKYCTKMLVIFPFETEVYKGTGLETEFVGHPLIEVVEGRNDPDIEKDDNLVLLLPGSRSNEINRLFVPMLDTAVELHKRHPELKFVASAPRETVAAKLKEIFIEFREKHKNEKLPEINITSGETGRYMQMAGTGLAASGTVTVECAIAGLPLTVCYRLNPLTYWFARLIVDIPYFTMVNLIADKKVYDEFLQGDVNAATLSDSMEKILPDGERRSEVEKDIKEVVDSLSADKENASRKTAEAVMKTILEKKS